MSEQESMNLDELLSSMKDKYDKLDNSAIYYPLRRLAINKISVQMVDLMKACLMAHEYGVDITIPFISYLMPGIDSGVLLNRLHRLGDNKLILLKRGGGFGKGNFCRWVLGDSFKNAYYGDNK
jgi:hypothetical protein